MAVELLAPAGSVDALRAAYIAGADAVYIGGNRFGARAYADNPDTGELLEAIRLTHRLGKRLYLTVNTLLKEEETKEVCRWMQPFYEEGLDAVIVQDLGVVRLFRERFPDLPVHASTQMAVTGPDGVMLLQRLGIRRVVPARELSVGELAAIRRETGIELETFIHGALCYSYSGQCLMSSLIGGRSGNRGRCAGICRLPYRTGEQGGRSAGEQYPLNMKDLCTLRRIPELIAAGISSFKIEGRMKKPEYTAGVVSVYRRAIDAAESGAWKQYPYKEELDLLTALYNRDGFTDGYYFRHNGPGMIALRNEKLQGKRAAAAQKVTEEIRKKLSGRQAEQALQMPVRGVVRVHAGEPVSCSLTASLLKPGHGSRRSVSVSAESEAAEKARTVSSSADQIRIPFQKTGGSPFRFEDLRIDAGQDCFVSAGVLKELRRKALGELEETIAREYRRAMDPFVETDAAVAFSHSAVSCGPSDEYRIVVSVLSRRQAEAALDFAHAESGAVHAVCLPAELCDLAASFHKNQIRVFLAMPYVFRRETPSSKGKWEEELAQSCWDGVLLRTLEETGMAVRLRESGRPVPTEMVRDATLYDMNSWAEKVFETWKLPERTLPYELNFRELRGQDTEGSQLIVYGRCPMMISAQCVRKTMGNCTGIPGWTSLTDRTGRTFPVYCSCDGCTNVIYNSIPASLLQESESIRHLHCGSVRVDFTCEGPEEVKEVLAAVRSVFGNSKDGSRTLSFPTTRGHFRRGVE